MEAENKLCCHLYAHNHSNYLQVYVENGRAIYFHVVVWEMALIYLGLVYVKQNTGTTKHLPQVCARGEGEIP